MNNRPYVAFAYWTKNNHRITDAVIRNNETDAVEAVENLTKENLGVSQSMVDRRINDGDIIISRAPIDFGA